MKEITINDYYVHYNDARSFLKLAKEAEDWKRSLFIRQLILQSSFALEALINQIFTRFSKFKGNPELFDHIEKLPTPIKIASAHSICEGVTEPILIKSEHLYSQIKELFRIRNDWAHGKGLNRLIAEQDGEISWGDGEGSALGSFPFLEIPSGIQYNDATRIPINPFELEVVHGEFCLAIVNEIEKRICKGFNISKGEIHSLTLYDEDGNKVGVYPIDKMWGAYRPKEKE